MPLLLLRERLSEEDVATRTRKIVDVVPPCRRKALAWHTHGVPHLAELANDNVTRAQLKYLRLLSIAIR
eukprot:CAMPEP_0119387386 /NCGR_PEP_ID=MMETSP1334-20130426/100458_1 /TAXON_ID=127549 /ORGANISM="Calcidiscus leptoporus, Strain RCC1130" /LENGTH=68 /DNA_ID=CAMNT_0007409115 /DNA_START=192 /DNA_END=398 /DNA_ORIENTATION=-